MEPRVTRRDRRLQLTYDLPHRIRCAQTCPTTAPNGSTVVFYGHDKGVKMLWRGGRRVKQHAAAKPAPSKQPDVIMLDDSDDEPPPPPVDTRPVEYEDEEDEQDPDAPYPNIIHELDVQLKSPVLRLAIPTTSTQPGRQQSFLKTTAIIAVATADGQLTVLRVPLAPPHLASNQDAANNILKNKIQLPCGKSTISDISIKVLTQFGDESAIVQSDAPSYSVLVAAASNALRLWRIPISSGTLKASAMTNGKVLIPAQATKVSFSGLTSSARIAVVDIKGAVRIYDPLESQELPARPSSSDSPHLQPLDSGQWLMTFNAPFQGQSQSSPTLPVRKKILDAKWVLSGRAILVILDDGEWGFWDLQPSGQSSKSIENFAVSGYVASATAVEDAEPAKPKKSSAKLAPLTPNSRKEKAEDLFTGPPKAPGGVARGGISVSASDGMNGQSEESVMLWYNNDIYSIANLAQYWQRNVSNAGGNATGSLYSSGFVRVGDVNLMNENITSIALFNARSSSSGIGQMNTTRDFLVSAEHRYIISQSTRTTIPSKGLFQQAASAATAPTDRDQRMLDAGELDIGGMDRMLDSMANGDGRPRRVGFAH